MNYLTIGMVILIIIAILYAIGRKKRTSQLDLIEQTVAMMTKEHQAELFGKVAYHGGLPQLPKPCILFIGVARDSLVFYRNRQFAAQVPFGSCQKIEKFSLKAKAGNFMKSTVMLGPLVPYLFKDKIRHFVLVEYIDINNEENNLLLETTKTDVQQKIHAQIDSRHRQYVAALG